MKKLTQEEVRALRKSGVKMPYVSPPRDEPAKIIEPIVPPVKEPPKEELDVIKSVLSVMKANEANTGAIIQVMSELTKPKPKKRFGCSVSRDGKGNINHVNIEEK